MQECCNFWWNEAKGQTTIKAKKSRNHTELLCKIYLPIKIQNNKNFDLIKINEVKKLKLRYTIPGDISSSAFFIVLTILNENSKLVPKNVNINSSKLV